MNILVCFKVLPNPDGILDEDWDSFSLSTDLSYAGLDYNCFDASALEIGLKLKEQTAVQGSNVTCTAASVCEKISTKFTQGLYSVGYDDVAAIKMKNREYKSREISRLISSYAKTINADIIITGAQAGYAETGTVPYYISEFLNYPILTGIEKASFSDGKIVCECRENGALIEKSVEAPIVLSINNSPEVLRISSLKARMACRTKTATENIIPDTDESEPQINLLRPKTGRVCRYLDKDKQQSREEILSILQSAASEKNESQNAEEENPQFKDFLSKNAIYAKTQCLYAQDFSNLLELYEKEKPSLLVLDDSDAGRHLAVKISENKDIPIFVNANILDINEKIITVKKHVCAANLEWKKDLEYPCVITASQNEIQKLKGIKSLLISSDCCDKLKWLKGSKTLIESQPTALSFAPLVIACGAGMGNKEEVQKARLLAEKLGAGFGLTRPSALNAWGSSNEIIGQSGTIISPKCCLVLGAAGAGAFMLGIENSKNIIAVNTDKNALIFKNADVGILCDAPTFVEELLSLL